MLIRVFICTLHAFFRRPGPPFLACLQVVRTTSGPPRTETPVRETTAAAAGDERFGRRRWPRASSDELETAQAAVFEEEGERGATGGDVLMSCMAAVV